jgi:hypothetical protein
MRLTNSATVVSSRSMRCSKCSTYRRTGSGVANQSDSLKGRVIEGLDIEKIKGALN